METFFPFLLDLNMNIKENDLHYLHVIKRLWLSLFQERRVRRQDMTHLSELLENNSKVLQAKDDQRRRDAKVSTCNYRHEKPQILS